MASSWSPGLLGTASVFLWYSPQGWELAATALRCICVVGVAFVAWAVIASSAAQSVRTQREIAATIAEIEWGDERLREDLIRVQRSAAEIVHGRVQGRIVAAALAIALQARRIDEGAPDASAGTVDALSEAAAILREARDDVYSIERADQASHRVDIVELLNSVGMAWRGVVDVDVDVDSSTVAAIDQSAPLAGHVAEVVREAVSNAARHGAARSVRIVLAAQAADTGGAGQGGRGTSGCHRDGDRRWRWCGGRSCPGWDLDSWRVRVVRGRSCPVPVAGGLDCDDPRGATVGA